MDVILLSYPSLTILEELSKIPTYSAILLLRSIVSIFTNDTLIYFIPHLVHVLGVKLDAGDAAGAGKAGAVLGRVRHVEDETILK